MYYYISILYIIVHSICSHIFIGCADEYLGYDMETKTNGYDCKEYAITTTSEPCKRRGSTWSLTWSNMFRAACKNTCSLYASEYCNQNTCHGEKYNIPQHGLQFASYIDECRHQCDKYIPINFFRNSRKTISYRSTRSNLL